MRTVRLLVPLIRRTLARARYATLGCLVVLGALQLVLVGQGSTFEQNHAYGRMAEFVPAFLQRGLGGQFVTLVSFKGTVAFGYFHPLVIMLLMVLTMYVTTEPALDVESRFVDLVLARSVPRSALMTRSLVAAAGVVVVVAATMVSGTWIGLRLFASPQFDAPSLSLVSRLLVHLVALAAWFGAFGLAVAARASRWTTAFITVALTTVVLYLIDFLAIGWRPMRFVAWASPFHYYPAFEILAGQAAKWRNLAVLFSGAIVFSVVAYWQFNRRDL